MATTFKYQAFTREGEERSGSVVATDEAEARARIGEGLVVTTVTKASARRSLLGREFKLRPNHVTLGEVAWMARNLATTQASGVPLFRALALVAKQRPGTAIGRVMEDIHQQLANGASLSRAFRSHESELGPLTCALIEAGEASGRLDQAFGRLADMLEARQRLRRKLFSSIAYPAVVCLLAIGLTLGMLLFVVPSFKGIYAQLGGELPALTQAVLALSNFARSMWFIYPLAVAGIVMLVLEIRRNPKAKRQWHAFLLRAPIFGPLVASTAQARVAATLSSLLDSGVGLLEALDLAASASGNLVFEEAIETARDQVREGRALSRALVPDDPFSEVFVQLLVVGEETGAVPALLGRYAKSLEDEVQTKVEGLTSVLEPLLIAGLGIIIGVMLVAFYLPLFNVANLVQQQ